MRNLAGGELRMVAERFDLLIVPAGGGDAVLETGVCEQGEDNAQGSRRERCGGPKDRGERCVDGACWSAFAEMPIREPDAATRPPRTQRAASLRGGEIEELRLMEGL